jgi:ParB/RepB/Spo0J family partition protein
MAAELQLLDIALIDDHPDNPRLFDRQEVIDGIAASLSAAGEFPQQHALHVRPRPDGRYQLLAGHHRKKAALKADIDGVWAWVEDLDDRQALMALVLDNRQGQLAPLEFGMHVLKAVPPAQGVKGQGLAAYAALVGKTQQYLTQLRQAAQVLTSTNLTSQLVKLIECAQHLAELHSLDPSHWSVAVHACLSLDAAWTLDRTREAVASVKDSLEAIPERWQANYLRPDLVVSDVIRRRLAPPRFAALVRLADRLDSLIRDHESDLPAGALAEYHDWLRDNAPGLSWDVKALQAYRSRVQALLGQDPDPEGESPDPVDVLLADPPWRYDFAETANRQIENQYPTMDLEALKAHLGTELAAGRLSLADDAVLFLWATAPKLPEALAVMDAWGFTYKTHAVWDKAHIGMGYWFRGQHEPLLVGTRGSFSPPDPDARVSSVLRAARGEHSAKPVEVYEIIERYFPDATKHELFLRGEPRPGWTGSGYEAGSNDGQRQTA